VRSTGQRGRGDIVDDDDKDAIRRRPRLLRALGWSHRDAVGAVVVTTAVLLILINGLALQPGPHPAPLVKSGVGSAAPAPAARTAGAPGAAPVLAGASTTTANLPRPRPAEAPSPKAAASKAETAKLDRAKVEPPAPARPTAEIVADIQRELARRGFYDGALDGRYGPKTDAAIRDFEQASGLKPSTEPSEALLRNILRTPYKARPSTPAAAPRPPAPLTRSDPIGEMLTPSKRVVAVQRALAEFGYGQLNPSGIIDGETQAAIEKFERERKLPITGQISHRVVRELAAITGRPLE
jgi:peptidoglycan hydrolase-like protein with peptidoglycan-binding domain